MVETLSPVLSTETERRIADILRSLCDGEKTLATAESCTGGLIASLFTDVDGLSHAFTAGLVCYTDRAKIELLDVPPDMIESEGAVSMQVAVAMAEGALARTHSDLALSVTGFAGAGGPDDEPGLVHFGLAISGKPTRHRERHFGDLGRGETRLRCITEAVDMLAEAVLT